MIEGAVDTTVLAVSCRIVYFRSREMDGESQWIAGRPADIIYEHLRRVCQTRPTSKHYLVGDTHTYVFNIIDDRRHVP